MGSAETDSCLHGDISPSVRCGKNYTKSLFIHGGCRAREEFKARGVKQNLLGSRTDYVLEVVGPVRNPQLERQMRKG